jgi:hypothetical protein
MALDTWENKHVRPSKYSHSPVATCEREAGSPEVKFLKIERLEPGQAIIWVPRLCFWCLWAERSCVVKAREGTQVEVYRW